MWPASVDLPRKHQALHAPSATAAVHPIPFLVCRGGSSRTFLRPRPTLSASLPPCPSAVTPAALALVAAAGALSPGGPRAVALAPAPFSSPVAVAVVVDCAQRGRPRRAPPPPGRQALVHLPLAPVLSSQLRPRASDQPAAPLQARAPAPPPSGQAPPGIHGGPVAANLRHHQRLRAPMPAILPRMPRAAGLASHGTPPAASSRPHAPVNAPPTEIFRSRAHQMLGTGARVGSRIGAPTIAADCSIQEWPAPSMHASSAGSNPSSASRAASSASASCR